MNRIILFANKNKQYNWLSNLSAYPIKIHGLEFKTNEHFYQSCKTYNKVQQKQIRESANGYDAMRLGRQADQRDDWLDVRVNIMRIALIAKINQNPIIKEKLLATGDSVLIEDTNNPFWGRGPDKSVMKGRNMLGKLWMELRQTYQEKELAAQMWKGKNNAR